MKMKKILLLTKDNSLQKELSAVLPKGYKIFKRQSVIGDSFIFADILQKIHAGSQLKRQISH